MKMHVFPNSQEMAKATALLISVRAARSIIERNRATVVLSGGEQTKAVLQALASPPLAEVTPWARMDFFFAVEHCLPDDDPFSVQGIVRRELLGRVPLPETNLHSVEVMRYEPEEAAARYQADIRTYFWGRKPEFDIALLNLGQDGHLAGLYPGHPLLLGGKEYAAAVLPPPDVDPQTPLVTLGLPVLRATRHVVLMASGPETAPAAANALAGLSGRPGPAVPASLLKAQDEIYLFMDQSCAPAQAA